MAQLQAAFSPISNCAYVEKLNFEKYVVGTTTLKSIVHPHSRHQVGGIQRAARSGK